MSKKRMLNSSLGQSVLVLGSSGRLGSCLIHSDDLKSNFELIHHSRISSGLANSDLTDRAKTFEMLEALKPRVIINTVALAEIEACEKDPNRAYRTNVLTVQNVVNWISESNASCHLVHISTDHLYDGIGENKEDQIRLTNSYAFSKFASELVARQVPSTVIRTNFVGKSKSEVRQTFSDWFIRCINAGQVIEVVNDIWFSPVTLKILSSAIATACVQMPQITVNFGSRGGVTKYEFCERVTRKLGLKLQKVASVSADECLAYRTYRPKNMLMDSSLWETAVGLQCPTIDEVIESVVDEYR
ncbi:MAG: sugar nucleotide-binding protein [Candidatus Nanopelagicales bacterium]